MIIQRVICDRCGFEQQEDDYEPGDWDQRFKREDVCRPCAKSDAALTEGVGLSAGCREHGCITGDHADDCPIAGPQGGACGRCDDNALTDGAE